MTNCLSGSVIRIKVVYRDFDNNLIDPVSTKVVISDKTGKKIAECTPLIKESPGTYYYDYVTLIVKKDTQYYCDAYDGDIVVDRQMFTTQFMVTS